MARTRLVADGVASTFTPMASPACIAAVEQKLGHPLRPENLPDEQLISPSDEWWQQWLGDNGVILDETTRSKPGVRLENQANEGHAAMAGQGFALLTPLMWVGDMNEARLAMPFPDRVSARGTAYWLAYPAERRMVPKIKRFREWLSAEVDKALADLAERWPQLPRHD